jgi:uncharacterized Zn finger protein
VDDPELDADGDGEGDGGDGDLVDLKCPQCDEVWEHTVLRAAEASWTVQCLRCRRVRTMPAPKQERFVPVPVILSEGATSRNAQVQVPLDGKVAIDDEFDLDGHRVRVTAVEVAAGQRPKSAKGRDVRTLYAVLFDTVTLHYTVNQGDLTRSFQEAVVPETEIHVGSVREVQGVRLAIKTLKSDQNRTLHRGFLYARNVTRVFADVAKTSQGTRERTRQRGAGPWGTQGKRPSNKDRKPRPTGTRRQ